MTTSRIFKITSSVLLVAGLAACAAPAIAAYPEKPIRLLLGSAPGGSGEAADVLNH